MELWPVPMQLLSAVARELEKLGVSREELLAETTVSPTELDDPDQLLPYRIAQQLLERAVCLSPIKSLGLAIGTKQTPSSLGVLGYGINCCPAIEHAMNMAVKYYRVSSTLVLSEWDIQGDNIRWKATPPVDLGKLLPCIIEEEFSTFKRCFELLTGKPLTLINASFSYPEPEYSVVYETVFGCKCKFSALDNQLIFPADSLRVPILQANPLTIATAERMCAEFLEMNPTAEDLVLEIRHHLLTTPSNQWREESVADAINITSRTLRNRLRALDTTFQAILDDLRRQIAQSDLNRSSQTIGKIAENLGYSDARSFRRAFIKWTGLTPDEFRKRPIAIASHVD